MKTILGKKIGMSQVFNSETGKLTPVTLVDVSDNFVSKLLKDKDGKVTHFEVGMSEDKKANKASKGNYVNVSRVPLFKQVFKFENGQNELTENDTIDADSFKEGDIIDVIGTSKGKGFAGVMKRWNFKGGKRTHGQSDRDRAPGSIGSGTTPGRVYKGKKMAGHMGNERITVKNLTIVNVDKDSNLIAIKGAIPGSNKSFVVIRESFFNNFKK